MRFLSWVVFLSAVASAGVYGWGWFAREFASHFGPGGPDYSDEVGGLYWLMAVVLPGYIYFRYPAKLLVVTTLGIAMLAGKGWDAFWVERRSRPPRTLLLIAVASQAGLAAAVAFKSQLVGVFKHAAPESLFGPFDAEGAWGDFANSLGHAAVVAAISWCLAAVARRRTERSWPMWAALAVTIVELGIAQLPLTALAPSELWNSPPAVLRDLPADRTTFRLFRDLEQLPSSWSTKSSAERQIEGLTWDRETLLPKYALKYGINTVNVPSTVANYDLYVLLNGQTRESDGGDFEPRRCAVLHRQRIRATQTRTRRRTDRRSIHLQPPDRVATSMDRARCRSA